MSDPIWAGPRPAPDELPKASGRLRPEYPDEMRNAPEIGYVLVLKLVDAEGRLASTDFRATAAPFQRAVADAMDAATDPWRILPAKRDGHNVYTHALVEVIFNPRAPGGESDRMPRLTHAAPVVVTRKPVEGGPRYAIVRVVATIDASGSVTAARPEKDEGVIAEAALASALKAWTFAPATRNGKPVKANLTLPVVVDFRSPRTAPPLVSVAPKPVHQEAPVYPPSMRASGVRGQVIVDFVVDKSGRVVDPFALSSTAPAFDWPAIEAVKKWRFEPGLVDGHAVNTHMQVPIIFQLTSFVRIDGEQRETGHDTFEVRGGPKGQSPPRLLSAGLPVYPVELARTGKKGAAKVDMVVDESGRVAMVKIVSASNPEFGEALAAAASGFYFEPSYKDGVPVTSVMTYEQKFDRSHIPEDEVDARLLKTELHQPGLVAEASALDEPLKPVSRRPPAFPKSLPRDVTSGDARIEFLVDEDGRARLPRIASCSQPAFGYAAIQAVAEWLFEPPHVKGRPSVVRVIVPFEFKSSR